MPTCGLNIQATSFDDRNSLEQLAQAWNRTMLKLGYFWDCDREEADWDDEYPETPAAQWSASRTNDRNKPVVFQKGFSS